MKDRHIIKPGFERLQEEIKNGDTKAVATALKGLAAAVGSRAKLISLLGINQSTLTRWISGSGHRGLALRVKRVLLECSEEGAPIQGGFTDAQIRAIVKTGATSANSLSFLIRVRDLAGFDFSEELCVLLLKEFHEHEQDIG